MESSLFVEPERWAESSQRQSGVCEPKQRLRFNLGERSHSLEESDVDRSDFAGLITSLLETNKLLYEELEQIQKDHHRTVETLSQCCRVKKSEENVSKHIPRGILKKFSKKLSSDKSVGKAGIRKSRRGEDKAEKWESPTKTTADSTVKPHSIPREISSSTSANPESEEENVSYSDDFDDNDSASSGRVQKSDHNGESCQASCADCGSLGMDAIKSMWDNFSLKDYDFITYADGPIDKSKNSSSHWTRKFTVPQPFKMTVRESARKKCKAEAATKPAEDFETDVRVQPVRIPPTTLMPIYELMKARDEQKKVERKKEIVNKMKSTLRPFSFEARETQKQEKKAELMKVEEEENYLKPHKFKARPVPSKLFDQEIKEKMLEEEDYRRIRRRMRADELLATSKLPKRMHESAQKDNKSDLHRKVSDEGEDDWFHPQITQEIPDYEIGYSKFRNKLAQRKRSKVLTIPEPFRLKTEELSLRRKKKDAIKAKGEAETKPKKNHSSPKLDVSHQPVIPSYTTQAQMLRQKKIEEKMSALHLKEMEEEERLRARKIERQIMQKIVKEAADKIYSSTLKLEEKRKKQAEERRRQQKMKSKKFYKELQEIDERVAARPLLLENGHGGHHKNERTEEFYSHALQKAGYSHKEIRKFLDSFQKEKSAKDDPD